jgi:predicted RNA polymerase sigma factor
MRAERHLDLEDPELAIRGLREGVKSIGPVPTLYIEMLDIQRFEGDNEAALLTVKDLLDTAPANPAWISMKGDVLADLGRHEESGAAHRLALELLDRLPQRNRQFPANRALRGALLGKLSDANPK